MNVGPAVLPGANSRAVIVMACCLADSIRPMASPILPGSPLNVACKVLSRLVWARGADSSSRTTWRTASMTDLLLDERDQGVVHERLAIARPGALDLRTEMLDHAVVDADRNLRLSRLGRNAESPGGYPPPRCHSPWARRGPA